MRWITGKQRNVIIAGGYLCPERDFGTEKNMRFVLDEASQVLTPILTDETSYFQPLGIEGAYLWVEWNDYRYEALNLASIEVDTARNVAHILESRLFEIPSEFDYAGATFRSGGAGLNFSGYILATETRYLGKITLENGLEDYKKDSVPYLETLTRIQ